MCYLIVSHVTMHVSGYVSCLSIDSPSPGSNLFVEINSDNLRR